MEKFDRKTEVRSVIRREERELTAMSDQIFDHPEMAFKEMFASGLLEDYLERSGFEVERGLGSLPTAFRAVFKRGEAGPRIGLLCEYDALPSGHACGHQLQGPAVAGAAVAVRSSAGRRRLRWWFTARPQKKGRAER